MAAAGERMIEFPHGYTYSAHPLACAAAIASLDLYREEQLFERAAGLSAYFEERAHALRGQPHVKDIRNLGLVAGIELDSRPGAAGQRGFDVFPALGARRAAALHRRHPGGIAALIIEKHEIDRLFDTIATALRACE